MIFNYFKLTVYTEKSDLTVLIIFIARNFITDIFEKLSKEMVQLVH